MQLFRRVGQLLSSWRFLLYPFGVQPVQPVDALDSLESHRGGPEVGLHPGSSLGLPAITSLEGVWYLVLVLFADAQYVSYKLGLQLNGSCC